MAWSSTWQLYLRP